LKGKRDIYPLYIGERIFYNWMSMIVRLKMIGILVDHCIFQFIIPEVVVSVFWRRILLAQKHMLL